MLGCMFYVFLDALLDMFLNVFVDGCLAALTRACLDVFLNAFLKAPSSV